MTRTDPSPRSGPGAALVSAYLADMERALRHADPGERDEVLAAVTEHIEQALAEKPQPISGADVEDVLADLGPVDRVAAGLDQDAGRGTTARRPGARPRWAPAATVFVGALSLPLIVVNPVLAALAAVVAVTAGVVGSRSQDGSQRGLYRLGAALGIVSLVLLLVAALTLLASGSNPPAEPSPPQPVPTPPAAP